MRELWPCMDSRCLFLDGFVARCRLLAPLFTLYAPRSGTVKVPLQLIVRDPVQP